MQLSGSREHTVEDWLLPTKGPMLKVDGLGCITSLKKPVVGTQNVQAFSDIACKMFKQSAAWHGKC
jgi:hypothetical protein